MIVVYSKQIELFSLHDNKDLFKTKKTRKLLNIPWIKSISWKKHYQIDGISFKAKNI